MKSEGVLFSVIIPATRAQSLPAALASIERQTYDAWELVVVGQGDDAAVGKAIGADRLANPRIRYVHIATPGLSRARNAGLEAARGELVAMTDDDCEAAPDWLEALADRFATHPEVGLIGGSMLAPPKPAGRGYGRCPHWEATEAIHLPGPGREMPPRFGIIGGNFAMRRELLSRVGPFDEHLGVGATFPAAEDSDYLLRACALGVGVLNTGAAVVHHSDGWRFGLRSVLRHQRQRGLGNGALAAKQTLAGDPAGRRELDLQIAGFRGDLAHVRRPAGAWYLPHFWLGYRRCLSAYSLDADGRLLLRRPAAVPAPPVGSPG
jgi:glycosyltransferase involved in cell wall biosynthesis